MHLFLDCMIDNYGVLKLPVISSCLRNLIVTVLMIMPVAQLVSQLFVYILHQLFVYNLLLFTAGRFDEDGSFIGQYGTLQRKQQEHLLQQQMQQQELGIKPGGTYV